MNVVYFETEQFNHRNRLIRYDFFKPHVLH